MVGEILWTHSKFSAVNWRGLMCIHRMKIVHRDLKSANCLVNKHWMVKICDFGLSRMMIDSPMRDSSSAGTPEWMAPELIRNKPFTEKCDIFSLGVIMWELCTLNRPWEGVPPERVCWRMIVLVTLHIYDYMPCSLLFSVSTTRKNIRVLFDIFCRFKFHSLYRSGCLFRC